MKEIDYRKPQNWNSAFKSIRKKCLDCCADSPKSVRECHVYSCPLWPYRFGKKPRTVGKKLYAFPDPTIFEIDDPQEATDYGGKVPVE